MKHPPRKLSPLPGPCRTWALLLALAAALALAGPAPVQAEEPAEAQVLMIPALSGYPVGTDLPLVLMLRLAPGQVLPEDDGRQGEPVQMALEAGPGVSLGEVTVPEPEEGHEHRGRAMVLAQLLVADNAQTGPRTAKGALVMALKDAQPQRVDFTLSLNILPAQTQPEILSPQMLERLGVEITLPRAGQAAAPPAKAEAASPAKAEAAPAAQAGDPLAGHSFWWLLLIVFAGGLGLNLTPCVYPLLPITVSYFGGRSQGSRGVLLANSLAYWAGMAAMYSTLGAFVSLSGSMLGEALTHPAVTLFLAAVMLALATSMFGLWEIKLPAGLTRLGAANRQGAGGAFLMGLTVGLLAAPCVGPFVLALMTHVAAVGQLSYGLAVFFVLSLGLGLPLTVLAFFSGSITRLPGAGEWMIWVRKFFGVVLVLMAISVARPLLGETASRWALVAAGLVGSLYLGFFEKSGKGGFLLVKKIAALVGILLVAVFWWLTRPAPVEHITWRPFTAAAFNEAARAGKPAVVDFSASWCAPCRQLESETFANERVAAALQGFDTIRVDVSTDPGPEAKDLMRQWRVRGVPTVAFLDRQGKMIPDLTLVGFEGPEEFLRRMAAALARSGPASAGQGAASPAPTAAGGQAEK